jgi:sporulation protein YlmC with PRC-barrel domain
VDLLFGADVLRSNGDVLGTLDGAIYDPGTKQIVSLVVNLSGVEERRVLLPIGAVDSGDEDVYVGLNDEQFNSLPPYVIMERNVAPPPEAENIDQDEITDPIDVADVLPVGAATGIESIAFTPIVSEVTTVASDQEALDASTPVFSPTEEVGVLRGLLLSDETDRIDFIRIDLDSHSGALNVPASSILAIEDGVIRVEPERAALEAAIDV